MKSDFHIEGKDGETQIATNGKVALTVYPDGPSRIRKRRAFKGVGGPNSHEVQWLFGELKSGKPVRCYVKEDGDFIHIILTDQDIYP